MKLAVSVVAVFASVAALASEPPRLDHLAPIELHDGINTLPGFLPGGATAIIVQTWRANGNAHSYHDWLVLSPNAEGHGAGVVAVGRAPNEPLDDLIRDEPFDERKVRGVIEFARGYVDGRPASLLLEARRALLPVDEGSLADPSVVTITVSVLERTDDEVGETPYEFVPLIIHQTSLRFCSAAAALSQELRIPVPPPYRMTTSRSDGCTT